MVAIAERAHGLRKAIRQTIGGEGAGRGPFDRLRALCERSLGGALSCGQFSDMAAQALTCVLFAVSGPGGSGVGAVRERRLGESPILDQILCILDGEQAISASCRKSIGELSALVSGGNGRWGRSVGRGDLDGCDASAYFHEALLRAYDPSARGARGVYFTPEPLVGYMVRSVDHLLRTRLECPMGLGQVRGEKERGVVVLDPACGTGVFLSGVADFVGEGGSAGLWGYELTLGSWAVAQLRLGGGSRVRIGLANALVGGTSVAAQFASPGPIVVVLGNPPYRGISENGGGWIERLLKGTGPEGSRNGGYYRVDGKSIGEKKVWLQDDYVKFMRYGQWQVEQAGAGIMAFITNHAYLDNPTFRGMRQSLLDTFDEIHVVDLHGNAKKKELCPDGSRDENMFDIQQGVSMGFFVLGGGRKGGARVRHADLWGARDQKIARLSRSHVGKTRFGGVEPARPFYFFVPRNESLRKEYERYPSIVDLMPVHSTGVVTARDHFVVDFDRQALLKRIGRFRSRRESDAAIRRVFFSGRGAARYRAGDTRGWKMSRAREAVRQDGRWRERVVGCLYRPFDERAMYYVPWMVDWPRAEVARHMLEGKNLMLITVRQVAEGAFNHVLVTDRIPEGRVTRSNRGMASMFPLFLSGSERAPNLNGEIIEDWCSRMGLRFGRGGAGAGRGSFGPEAVLRYVYAVLHSPGYRRRYGELLRSEFPRVPLTGDAALFGKLVRIGGELVRLHLMKGSATGRRRVGFGGIGDNLVAPGHPRYEASAKGGRVTINRGKDGKGGGQFFEGVSREVWEFQMGGYAVCRKWLADRRGRTLSEGEIEHYQRMVTCVGRTMRLMRSIDEAISEWPMRRALGSKSGRRCPVGAIRGSRVR